MKLAVGIPTKNEATTISGVAEIADLGLHKYFPYAEALIINADNGSTDGTRKAFMETETRAKKLSINTGTNKTGKGTNVFAIMEAALAAGCDALVLIDGDLRSAQPEWIGMLLEKPLRHLVPAFVTPEYARSRYEANSTNQLVRPYLRAAFGLDVRQPIGGEFAMNRAFIEGALTWKRADSTELYGIDVWLTTNTALHGYVLEQVAIGRKVHNATFPKIYKLGQQVLDALFRLMLENRPAQPNIVSSKSVGLQIDEGGTPLPQDMVTPITDQASRYIVTFWDELVFTFPSLVAMKRPTNGALPHIDTAMWTEILAAAYFQLDESNFRRIRDHVVALFPARVVSYWSEIEGMTAAQVDALLDGQSQRLAEIFALRPLPETVIDLTQDAEMNFGYWGTNPDSAVVI